ncbi:hypothetical protein Tco_1296749 [Tanacetum coccineum]
MVGSWFRMFKGDRIIIRETLLGELVQREMGEHRIELGMPMRDKMLLMQAQENGAVLDEEELLFLADECDAFDLDVDDEPTAQSIFMANLSSTGPENLQVGLSNASILSEVHDLENTIDHCNDNQDKHETHNRVQQKHVIDSNGADMGNSNVIPYEQYLTINEVSVEPSCASSVLNDAYVLHDNNAYIPHDPLVIELNIYKQQVAMYEQHAKFDLTLREQKIDEQMSILIQDHNKKEENLKKELHSVKLQLNSTIKSNKIIKETVPRTLFTLEKSKMVQPALYDGDEILKTHHVPVSVTSSEEDLEILKTHHVPVSVTHHVPPPGEASRFQNQLHAPLDPCPSFLQSLDAFLESLDHFFAHTDCQRGNP